MAHMALTEVPQIQIHVLMLGQQEFLPTTSYIESYISILMFVVLMVKAMEFVAAALTVVELEL